MVKRRIAKLFNAKVIPRYLNVGDLILRWADVGGKNSSQGKLAPNWKGLYWVTAKTRMGAYYLETLEKKPFPQIGNRTKLRRYYC